MGQSSVGFNPVFAAIRVKTFTYEEMLFPLLKGHRPTNYETERELLRAVVVSTSVMASPPRVLSQWCKPQTVGQIS